MECNFENCPNFERLGKQFADRISELEQENDKLKEEVETRDNLIEHFRKESINWAKISNDCIKDIENYKQTLQEIKEIAESKVKPNLVKRMNGTAMYGISKIIELTKAEEE